MVKVKKVFETLLTPMARISPKGVVYARYFLRFHRFPNLRKPKDLNEKILYLKLFTDTSSWTRLADKYQVREYVKSCGLGDILIPLIGVWERVEDIPFGKFPRKVMFKANNGDGRGTNKVVDVQSLTADGLEELKAELRRWLNKKDIGALSAEPQYRDIPPLIVAEEVLPVNDGFSSLVDYKIWCFNGKPYSILVCTNRADAHAQVCSYDLDWHRHPEHMVNLNKYSRYDQDIPRPSRLSEMIEAARVLSKPFPEVRVDLYEVNGRIYFGELTFTSLGGMMNYYTTAYLKEMGAQITLPPRTR